MDRDGGQARAPTRAHRQGGRGPLSAEATLASRRIGGGVGERRALSKRRATASVHKLPRCGSLSRNPLLSLSQIGRSGAGPVSESISADSCHGERFETCLGV